MQSLNGEETAAHATAEEQNVEARQFSRSQGSAPVRPWASEQTVSVSNRIVGPVSGSHEAQVLWVSWTHKKVNNSEHKTMLYTDHNINISEVYYVQRARTPGVRITGTFLTMASETKRKCSGAGAAGGAITQSSAHPARAGTGDRHEKIARPEHCEGPQPRCCPWRDSPGMTAIEKRGICVRSRAREKGSAKRGDFRPCGWNPTPQTRPGEWGKQQEK